MPDRTDGVDLSELEARDRSELDRSELEAREPAELPITDVFDLHSFRPAEVADVTRAYLDAAYEKGLRSVRIIHGRGVGVQRRTVRRVLERDPRVVEFADAPPEAGGWGATLARLE